MLVYSYYENDNRVKRYAEALAKRGDYVDVVSLRHHGQPIYEVQHGVNVHRIQTRTKNERFKLAYLAKLLFFFINSGVFSSWSHLKKGYDLIHVHSVPDFEIFTTLIPKLFGAKTILDIHDIVPEFYASKFRVSKDSPIFKALLLVEKASIAFSDHTIIANHIWEQKLLSRSVKKEKCSVFLNYPDPEIFCKHRGESDGKRLVFIYPGTLNWHQGLDVAFRAFALVKDKILDAEFHIYGDGQERNKLKQLAKELGITDRVLFKGFIPMEQIAEVMAQADIGVVPKRNDSFGGEAFSTKIFEFMALGIPVIASATTIDSYYFNNSVVQFFKPEDERDLARCMLLLGTNKEVRDSFAHNAVQFVAQYTWDKKKQEYFNLVDRLVGQKNDKKYVDDKKVCLF